MITREDYLRVLVALKDAIEHYEGTLEYKLPFLVDKHGDRDEVARLQRVFDEAPLWHSGQ